MVVCLDYHIRKKGGQQSKTIRKKEDQPDRPLNSFARKEVKE